MSNEWLRYRPCEFLESQRRHEKKVDQERHQLPCLPIDIIVSNCFETLDNLLYLVFILKAIYNKRSGQNVQADFQHFCSQMKKIFFCKGSLTSRLIKLKHDFYSKRAQIGIQRLKLHSDGSHF